jgi:hypothetical protein
VELPAVMFVSPRSADDSVGEVAFVGSSCFESGLAFGGLAGEGWSGRPGCLVLRVIEAR